MHNDPRPARVPTPDVTRLAVFAPGWLGDAVMALPAIADVRRALPGCAIHVVAKPSVAPLFALVPGVDAVVPLGGGSARGAAIEALRRARYDAALLLPNSFNAAYTAWRAGIPARWGYRSDGRSLLLTRGVPNPAPAHQAGLYQHLVRALGFSNGPCEPRLVVSTEGTALAERTLIAAGWTGGPLVAFAPGAAYGGAKRWPAASYGALAKILAGHGVSVVLVGSPADRPAADEVSAIAGRHAIDLVGRTDVPGLAAVLAVCRAAVTNDSGAMHVASALGVPVVALFGPTRERETRPLGAAEPTVLVHDVWCRPCMLRECPLTHACMRGLPVERVAAAVEERL